MAQHRTYTQITARIHCAVLFVIALIFFAIAGGCSRYATDGVEKKVLILGFDGMDPQILERLVQEGKLPNFRQLMETGDYTPLKTSIPPQSPVAWSNFITGMNPGGHGIFDFIHRDPQTMRPYLSTTKTEAAKHTLSIGNWVIPLSEGSVTLLRKGKSFWEILNDHGVPTTIVRVPANFPPVDTPAHQISGMGTPDLQGTYGTFSFYTDEPPDTYGVVSGGKVFPVEVVNHQVTAQLLGPKNSFKAHAPKSVVDFTVFIDPENPIVKIEVHDQQLLLKEGEWSDWIYLKFEMIPFLHSVSGMCRFYLKAVRPHFQLYVTPVNIDPASPVLPISTPGDYAEELSEEIGPFYTQGIPEDTKALSADIFDDGEFLQQTGIVLKEERRLFDYELSRFDSGLLFFYFGRVDQLGHMFWRTMDPNHPAHSPSSPFQDVIEQTYHEMDAVLGKTLKNIDTNTTLIIMSDHGFAPFYRTFNLNTWLKSEGYVSVFDNSEGEFLQDVDWSATRAYGLGFNGLYVNTEGRERDGIVQAGIEKDALLDELSRKLLEIRDQKTGARVISRVYRASEVYTGPFAQSAPDLIIGYNRGYRASWETALGKFSKDILRDNSGKWSGDHLMEAELVPGILLSNQQIQSTQPALYDLAPTILSEFGVPRGADMIGNDLL